jgi:glutaconate CoA-transferase subunit B
VLIYESGTIGTRANVLPLSIGDGELAETALCVVPLPEIFSFYLQAGRIDTGFLSAAQIDRFGNLNSTVIGSYDAPRVRLPGAGGAPEIAAHAKRVLVMLRASPRSFVKDLDFRTSAGHLDGKGARARAGMPGGGPHAVVTDFGILTPHPENCELQLTALFADTDVDTARSMIGWPLHVASRIETLPPPSAEELDALRALNARTKAAHARSIRVPVDEKATR